MRNTKDAIINQKGKQGRLRLDKIETNFDETTNLKNVVKFSKL